MEKALREIFAPKLREKGFKGSLPHFRRISLDRVDYVSVQFNTSGGSFVVEVVAAGPNGKPTGYGKDFPIEKLTVAFFRDRLRLGSEPEKGEPDHWFQFGPKSYEFSRTVPGFEHFESVAVQAASFVDSQMESWLRSRTGASN